MPLPIPDLDNLDFEALVEQARGFIPRYAPEWTDHNIHDPGITLLELAAWLVDQQIYRVGFVSDRHIRAFAALLGVYSKPAEPAQGLIWPNEIQARTEETIGVNLAAGAEAVCFEQPDIRFELAASVYLSPARFAAQANQQQPIVSRITGEKSPSLFVAASGTKTRTVASALQKNNDNPQEIQLLFDRPLIVDDGSESYHPVSIGIELVADKSGTRMKHSPGGYLVADYRIESGAPTWRRVAISTETTAALNQTGIVLIHIPAVADTAANAGAISRLRIRAQQRINPLPPRIKSVDLNVLPVIQTETVPQSVIGVSNGMPDQSYQLDLEFLSQGKSPIIEVVEDDRFVAWEFVEELVSEGPDERGFVLDSEENKIHFGNGVNGKIPPNNAQIRHLDYKLTQGKAGSLQSGLTWTVVGVPTGSGQTIYGTNPAPFFDGVDAWNMERLIGEARSAALNRTVMLTNRQLEEAAKSQQGMAVERADVLTGFHPSQPQRHLNNSRTLVVIPGRAEESDATRAADQSYCRVLERLLQPRRVLGERLSILPARRKPIRIQADLLYEDGMDANAVIEEARKRLQARFTDLPGGGEWDIDPWPLGRDVMRQEIKTLLARTTGVAAVTRCRIATQGEPFQLGDITLQRDEIAIGIEFTINASSIAQQRN